MRTVCVLFVAMVVGGCNGGGQANSSNFTRALDEFLAVDGVRCLGATQYPSAGGYRDDLLGSIGFLEPVGDISSDLTDLGRQHFVAGKGFCLGVPKVKLIENFSIPSASGPQIVSEVVYHYEVESIPDWARNEAFAQLVPLGRVRTRGILISTANGWVHETLFRR